ncbi:MAG: protein-methionine-sulfoxide reductase catalytic subunit MsrP [Alphaproteobacteria bacterium]|nr:MAG: protein-methionine-sulfoxide reductase catalytic subunit MsrP [Alphaproteobacteria bacterium]
MLIHRPPAWALREADATPETVYWNRRAVLAGLGFGAAGLAASPAARAASTPTGAKLAFRPGPFSTDEPPTPWEDVTSYNNFYEFGTDKSDPAKRAHSLVTEPWSVTVSGHVGKSGTVAFEDLIRPHQLQERIYRHRCVEAWSMVIPWVGVPLAEVIKRFEPTADARFVQFVTLHDPRQMPGQRWPVLDWPYVEGLRMDEAMNPLALLAVGLYGRVLPNQNGAPLRLVVPWKYGFKSIKSIVAMRFVKRQPDTSWNKAAPREYGFYANVNPKVDHPRWSQATERRIGGGLLSLFKRQDTLMFNGYAEEVASLYRGMDLRKYY